MDTRQFQALWAFVWLNSRAFFRSCIYHLHSVSGIDRFDIIPRHRRQPNLRSLHDTGISDYSYYLCQFPTQIASVFISPRYPHTVCYKPQPASLPSVLSLFLVPLPT